MPRITAILLIRIGSELNLRPYYGKRCIEQGEVVVRKPVSKIPTTMSSPKASCNGITSLFSKVRPRKSQLLVVCNCSVLLLNTDMTPSMSAIYISLLILIFVNNETYLRFLFKSKTR